MKSLVVLMVCLTINILRINSECVPQELDELDAETFAATWHLVYMHKNYTYFERGISNVVEKMKFTRDKEDEDDDGKLEGTVTYLDKDDAQQTIEATWSFYGAMLYSNILKLGKDPNFLIKATDYDNYHISYAAYVVDYKDYESTEVYIRDDKCDDENAIKAAKDGISKLCLNFDEFVEDPKKKCSSS